MIIDDDITLINLKFKCKMKWTLLESLLYEQQWNIEVDVGIRQEVIRIMNIEAAIQKNSEVEVDSQWGGEAKCLQNIYRIEGCEGNIKFRPLRSLRSVLVKGIGIGIVKLWSGIVKMRSIVYGILVNGIISCLRNRNRDRNRNRNSDVESYEL
ncbi:hypothetical protein DPMN_038740 [Dreissena polymorpha]|uniref:Uncharacterized protein n=1 Tax=Dreissena polymorpha TaxID=45954 RepID=A0A9D4RNY6_DREPO|nr:hypothetical protein DPMN_038740 [Dreissena polymorpha]